MASNANSTANHTDHGLAADADANANANANTKRGREPATMQPSARAVKSPRLDKVKPKTTASRAPTGSSSTKKKAARKTKKLSKTGRYSGYSSSGIDEPWLDTDDEWTEEDKLIYKNPALELAICRERLFYANTAFDDLKSASNDRHKISDREFQKRIDKAEAWRDTDIRKICKNAKKRVVERQEQDKMLKASYKERAAEKRAEKTSAAEKRDAEKRDAQNSAMEKIFSPRNGRPESTVHDYDAYMASIDASLD